MALFHIFMAVRPQAVRFSLERHHILLLDTASLMGTVKTFLGRKFKEINILLTVSGENLQ